MTSSFNNQFVQLYVLRKQETHFRWNWAAVKQIVFRQLKNHSQPKFEFQISNFAEGKRNSLLNAGQRKLKENNTLLHDKSWVNEQ